MKIAPLTFLLLFVGSAFADIGRVRTQDGLDQSAEAAVMYSLAHQYAEGAGVPRDFEEALKWYYRAAELGNAEAMNALGVAYATGRGVPVDHAESLRWFVTAAERGSISAMSNIGKAYYHGVGVPLSYAGAAKWFAAAAMNGHPDAMNNLGLMYATGKGLAQNHGIALGLFRRAAQQGHSLAMLNLGVLYAKGEAVKRDDVVAFAWLSASLNAGLPDEKRNAASYTLGALATKLGPKKLARAKRLADEISAAIRQSSPIQPKNDTTSPKGRSSNTLRSAASKASVV